MLSASQVVGQAICKPGLTLQSTSVSEALNLRRVWRATYTVDASQCATRMGLFALEFVREQENGLPLTAIEPFLWRHGETVARIDLWHDEAIDTFRIVDLSTCPCSARQ